MLTEVVADDSRGPRLGRVDRWPALPDVQLLLHGHLEVPLVTLQHVAAHRHIIDARQILELEHLLGLVGRQAETGIVA